MAKRLIRRTYNPPDVNTPGRLLDVLNPLYGSLFETLAAGITLDNVKKVILTAKVKPPDEWVPLTLPAAGGFTRYTSSAFPLPGYASYQEGGRVRVRLRGLLTRGSPPAFGTVIATGLPTPAWQARHDIDGDGAHAFVETRPNGTLTYGAGSTSAYSLEDVNYETTDTVPLWTTPTDITLKGERGVDLGEPFAVICLGATRKDKVPVHPEDTPVWEALLLGEGHTRERKLRIRRLYGLQAGIEHDVRFLCLYP